MSSDIKAAFFDIDGTLTSFVTHVVPRSTIDALHALQKKDVKVFICSGRAPSYMGVVLDTIPVEFDGIVGLNGQFCTTRDGLDYRHPIDLHDVEIITDWLQSHTDVVANYAESNYGYFNRINATFQISPYVDKATEAEIAGMCGNVRGVRWHPDVTDLIPADGGKAVGMQVVLEHFGWSRDNAIAFGDGGNDVDMLRFAGIGVAMGNATDEPKTVADYVTDSVDDAGISNALHHFEIL